VAWRRSRCKAWYLNNLQTRRVRIVWPGRRLLLHAETRRKNLHSKYLALFAFFTLIFLWQLGRHFAGNTASGLDEHPEQHRRVFSVVTVIAVLEYRRTRLLLEGSRRGSEILLVSIFYFAFALLAGAIAVLPAQQPPPG